MAILESYYNVIQKNNLSNKESGESIISLIIIYLLIIAYFFIIYEDKQT